MLISKTKLNLVGFICVGPHNIFASDPAECWCISDAASLKSPHTLVVIRYTNILFVRFIFERHVQCLSVYSSVCSVQIEARYSMWLNFDQFSSIFDMRFERFKHFSYVFLNIFADVFVYTFYTFVSVFINFPVNYIFVSLFLKRMVVYSGHNLNSIAVY